MEAVFVCVCFWYSYYAARFICFGIYRYFNFVYFTTQPLLCSPFWSLHCRFTSLFFIRADTLLLCFDLMGIGECQRLIGCDRCINISASDHFERRARRHSLGWQRFFFLLTVRHEILIYCSEFLDVYYALLLGSICYLTKEYQRRERSQTGQEA